MIMVFWVVILFIMKFSWGVLVVLPDCLVDAFAVYEASGKCKTGSGKYLGAYLLDGQHIYKYYNHTVKITSVPISQSVNFAQ